MKKSIKILILLIVVLSLISMIIIPIFGNIQTLKFQHHGNNYKLNINNPEKIEIIEEKKGEKEYIVKIKAKKPGKVYVMMVYEDFADQKVLYIHKSHIITDNNYFGYSRGSEVIPISISIILLYILHLLIIQYKKHTKENLYQYKNVAYLGIIIFLSNFTISNLLSIIHYQGLYETINKAITSISNLSFLLLPIAFITFILVTISNIKLIRREGKSFKNVLGVFLGIFICILTILPDRLYMILLKSQFINIHNLNSIGPYLYNFVEMLIYLIVSYLECILIGTIVISIKTIRRKIAHNKDYMIILGCKISKEGELLPLIKGRVDRALEFRKEQLEKTGKDLIFIPSGGKGNDETISEAEAMKKYLLKAGIKEKNILIENQSKNTYENIKFSNKLVKNKKANIAFATTNYHVFRAGLLATEQGLQIEGIGSKTKAYFWVNAFIREFVGTLYSERKKHLIVFSLILLLIIIMIAITYFANNI